jgi:hypothetical protein
MVDIPALKAEIDADPLTRGYAGMSDSALATSLNTANRDNWISLSSSQIFETIDIPEFQALNAANKARIDRLLGLGDGIQTAPGSQARSELVTVFGGGSVTIAALAALANKPRSRARELGLEVIKVGHVQEARA